MPYLAWPLRIVPKRNPPIGRAIAVTALSLGGAIVLRLAILGVDEGLSLSATYFPAFVLATLYGGLLYGVAALAVAMGLSVAAPSAFVANGRETLSIMFALSGAFTVLFTAAFRESLLRLKEGQSALQQVRDDLERSEALARLAQEVGGFGFWDWDFVEDAGHWSPGLYRIHGIDPATPPSQDRIGQAVHPDDIGAVRRTNLAALASGRMEAHEFRVILPDGQVRWIMARAELALNADGQVTRAVGVNFDITDQKLGAEQLRESEVRFRALADSAPVLMWVSRADGVREFVNRAYVDFLGSGFDDALAFDWRKRLHEDDLQRILDEQVRGESSGGPFTLEARYRRADGEWRWIRSVSQPRKGPDGKFIGFIGVGYDVTDAKRAEADLTRINEILAERIEAALAQRDNAEAALRQAQKLEAVGQLTGGVAHDFNNLLTVIMGALDLMQRHPTDGARRDRMIEAALGAAQRGERLTQQLLAFSRRQALRPQIICVDDLILGSAPLLHRAVGEAVALTIAPAAPGELACIDASQFEAAIMNMIVNARDAVAGGGSIRIETVRCLLSEDQVDGAGAGPHICVAVHDTGVGMDAEVIARVFEPFFTTKAVGKGTGLGLSQVYGFARQSGGGVLIDSAPGKGASVRLYLPVSLQSETPVEPQAQAQADGLRGGPPLRVLLVEDDAPVGDLIAAMLEDLGHAVIRAESVHEALPILRSDRPVDLLLTDLIMPGGRTGVDLAREAVELRAGLPVILSSGYTGDTLSAADGAPWPLLRKPYDSAALARLIDQVTRASAATGEGPPITPM